METSKIIYEGEKKENHNITRFNGLINGIITIKYLFNFNLFLISINLKLYYMVIIIDSYACTSIYQFINSFRESNESPFPELKSEATMEALKMLKSMKDEIGEGKLKVK